MKLNSQGFAIIAFIMLIVLSGLANWYDEKSGIRNISLIHDFKPYL